MCRAQSSYRETVASLRSEERGAGLVSAQVHCWHGWQILIATWGHRWRCDLLSLELLVPGSRRRLLKRPRFPGPWANKKRRPARGSGCFCSAESTVQARAAAPLLYRWPVHECKWSPGISIYVRSKSPQIIEFPSHVAKGIIYAQKPKSQQKRREGGEDGRRFAEVRLSR